MILTTLPDYAKQKGITRARAYQLKPQLQLIELPVYAIGEGLQIPLHKDGTPLQQTYVVQDRAQLEAELSRLKEKYNACATRDVYRLRAMIRELEIILK